MLPSALMTADVVKSAHQILMHLVRQKMALLPDGEGLVGESQWEDYRVEVNDSFIDSHRVFNIPATGQQLEDGLVKSRLSRDNFQLSSDADGIDNGKFSSPTIQLSSDNVTFCRDNPRFSTDTVPSFRRSRSSLRSKLERNQTVCNGTGSRFSNVYDRYTNSQETNSLESNGTSTVCFEPVISKRRHTQSVDSMILPKKQCPQTVYPSESKMRFPLEEKSVSLGDFCSQNSSGEVMILTEDNEIASVLDTRKRKNVPSDRRIIGNNSNLANMDEVSQSPKSDSPSMSGDATSGSTQQNQIVSLQECTNDNNFSKFDQLPHDDNIDRTFMLQGAFQIKTPAKDISELTDDELVDYCARKMRKLLLLPGMVVGAATICQKRLFPPVPKNMRLEHPRTTHPVWAAIEYLKRLTKLDLGELVHPVYRFQSIYFRKIRLEYMTPKARAYLKRLFVTDEEYEQSYPKFDDSYCSSFTLVEDDIAVNKTPGKGLTYIYNATE